MGWGLCTVAGVAGKGETLDVVPRFLITGRRVAGSSFGGLKGREQVPPLVDRWLAGEIDVAAAALARAHARRGQQGFELMEAQDGIRSSSDSADRPSPVCRLPRAMARIGLLTGGGDCPGLNAVIRAVVRKGINTLRPRVRRLPLRLGGRARARTRSPLTHETTSGILHRGGTILGTSRTNVFKEESGLERVQASLEKLGLDALIPIGGEDTLGVAGKLVGGRASTSSASRRRSTTTSRAPTSRSASRPRCRSPPTRSTACTRRPSRTTA